MPPPPVCNKCRQIQPSEGDSWCSACSSWEFLGRELGASWDSVGARVLAGDLVVNAARQVRALRSLSAGLARSASTQDAGVSRATLVGVDEGRASLPRRRSLAPPPPPPPKEEDLDSQESEESEERPLSPTPEHKPLKGGDRRPPEPDQGPRHTTEVRSHRKDRDRSRRDTGRRKPAASGGHRTRGKHKTRGGRKHLRLKRLAEDPTRVIHRKPSADFWELSSLRLDPLSLGGLGR